MALDDLTLQDATIAYPEQNFTHAPVERMQSLSHMLKDRLTLATFRTDHGWDVDMDLAEKRLTISSSKYPSKDSWQQYPKYYSKHSPRSDDLSILSGKFTREGPITVTPLVPSKVFERDFEKSNQQSLVDSHENDSYQSQDFQSNYPQYHHQQRQGQLRLRSQSSGSTRENRDLLDWTTQISSPALDSSIIKPKRKYIKKSTLLSQATTERYSQSKFQPKRESNELLYSDRGLILKTQIPKKGRPISKHSTNSPQCTTISTSLSNLPTSQLYIAKSNSASSTSLTISTATSNRHSVDSLPHREYQISTFESQTNHDIPLTGRRLGRPLSNTLSRNVHSQSYTGTFSSSSSRSQNEQTQPISNPTSHEFDRNSSQYSNRHEQGSDNSRLLPCRGRSPTFSVMTTVSPSQHPSRQLGDQNDQSMPSSHHQYTASPIDQQFSVEELGVHEEDSKSGHLDQRYRSAGNISALPHRSFTEGIPTKLNTLKRSSSGMQKSLSMDGCHVRSIDARRRLSTNDGGSANRERGESDPMSYDSKERCEKIDKFGSKFSDNGYDDDTTFDMRSRKRISGSDLNRVERGDSCDGGSGIKRIHHGSHSSKDNSWHEMNLKGDHRRPQSLVLLREFMESEMAQTMATSVPEARPKSEYMRRIMSGDQRYIDSYDNRNLIAFEYKT
ncbi:hypothetical protein FBU30_006838 [Linnemannia zychae]|nr:hypothetical protein FBU30_006838 [Linnemannia zychae]